MDDPATAEAPLSPPTPDTGPAPVPSATAEPAPDAPELDPDVVEAHRKQGIDAATGFAITGEWPTNGRLRAEAMSRAGVDTDPDGLISDDLIVQAGERLALEAEEEEQRERDRVEAERVAAAGKPTIKWLREDLVAYATRIGAPHESDANKETILAAIQAVEGNAGEEA